jgi:hypothetical protein
MNAIAETERELRVCAEKNFATDSTARPRLQNPNDPPPLWQCGDREREMSQQELDGQIALADLRFEADALLRDAMRQCDRWEFADAAACIERAAEPLRILAAANAKRVALLGK